MVEDAHAHQFAGLAQAGGNFQILAAGGGVAGGVVVNEEDGGRRLPDHRGEDLAGMDDTGGEAPLGDLYFAQHPVFAVKQQCEEYLFAPVAQPFVVVPEDLGRGGEAVAGPQRPGSETPGDLENGLKFRGLGRADATQLAEFTDSGAGQFPQGAEACQQHPAMVKGTGL